MITKIDFKKINLTVIFIFSFLFFLTQTSNIDAKSDTVFILEGFANSKLSYLSGEGEKLNNYKGNKNRMYNADIVMKGGMLLGCHHGMKKHGYDFVPEKWDISENEWQEHQTRVR